jgi:methylmalonyl-CoA/ethylmalonyl-CoA epimerase
VGRFLEKRGEGLHHVAFMVASIDTALESMREQGARLIDEGPVLAAVGRASPLSTHPTSVVP